MNPIDQVVDQHTAEPDSRRADSDRIVELERENQRLREIERTGVKVNALARPEMRHGVKFFVIHHKEFLALRAALENT